MGRSVYSFLLACAILGCLPAQAASVPEQFPESSREKNVSSQPMLSQEQWPGNPTVVTKANTGSPSVTPVSKQDNPPEPVILQPASLKLGILKAPLTLQDVIQTARNHYPSLREADARISLARAGVGVAKTAYLPSLDLFVQTTYATYNRLPGLSFSQIGILPVAGPSPKSQVNDFVFGHYSGALLTWNAFDFGTRRAEVNRAKAEVEVAAVNRNLTELEVIAQAISAYLRVQTAQRLTEATLSNLNRTRVFEHSVATLVKSGLRPGVDGSRALADVARAKTRYIQAQQEFQISKALLAQVIGSAGEELTLQNEPFLDIIPGLQPTGDSLDEHPLLSLQQTRIDLIQARQKVLQRSHWPQLFVQGGINGRGSDLNASADNTITGRGLYPTRANFAMAVNLAFTPSDILVNRAKLKQIRFEEVAEKAKYDQFVQKLTGSLAQAKAQINAAIQVAQHTPLAVQAAHMTEVQSRSRYKAGLATLVDVADAQRLLVDAQIDDALARLSVWNALLSAAKAKGKLDPFIQLTRQEGAG